MAKMTDKAWKAWVAQANKRGTKKIKPHKAIGECRSCGVTHNRDYHRSHGKGAFKRTHGSSGAGQARAYNKKVRRK